MIFRTLSGGFQNSRRVFLVVLFLSFGFTDVLHLSIAQGQAASTDTLILTREDVPTRLGDVLAVSPQGKRIYIGEKSSRDFQRLNLTVLTVNQNSVVDGKPRRYADTVVPLPPNTHATVTDLLPDARHRKLYVSSILASDKAETLAENRLLSVYDLDANGEPVGKPRAYDSGNAQKSLLALARHPSRDLLYMTGGGDGAIFTYRLDAQGEPSGQAQRFAVGDKGKHQIAVSTDGKRLYLGTYPDALEIVDLDANGLPTGQPRLFKAGTQDDYLRFEYSPRALFQRHSTFDGPRLSMWPLDEKGDPIGQPQLRNDLPLSTLTVDVARNQLWLAADSIFRDAFNGNTIVDGVRTQAFAIGVNDDLTPAKAASKSVFRQRGVALAAVGGRAVLLTEKLANEIVGNRAKDYRLRVTLEQVRLGSGEVPPVVTLQMDIYGRKEELGKLSVGQSSGWVNLDPHLKDNAGIQIARIFAGSEISAPFAPNTVAQLKLRVEIAEGDPAAGGRVLRTMTDEVKGHVLIVLLPGYAYGPPEERLARFEPLSERSKYYLAQARAVAIKPQDRPRLFSVSPFQMLGGQGHLGQLEREAETMALMGFNTVNSYWWGALPPATVNAVLDKYGLTRRTSTSYQPPSYFDFDAEKMNPAVLQKWADEFPPNIARENGAAPPDVFTHHLSDEPGWYYPTMLRQVRDNPQKLETFRAYLRGQGLQPADVGGTAWEQIFPIGQSVGAKAGAPLAARRLFYWTMRFFPESASLGHKRATEALRRAYGHPIRTPVNWNNWMSTWYVPAPNQRIFNNPIQDDDSAFGSFDWFTSGRTGAHTLWSEDWFTDSMAQQWAVLGDLLRSASMLGDEEFGGYVIGDTTGTIPTGAKYKMMTLLAHGGKILDFFTWGPDPLFPGNGWSEELYRYGPIADGLRLVGRSERLVHPGRPARGKIALLVPAASRLWETDQREPYYYQESFGLHYALTHASYTVDFVDDTDLAGDQWTKRGYTTLYITGPNVMAKAQERVAAWVRGGGTLVATAGAGVADEYNTPTTKLDSVLGVQTRLPIRVAVEPDESRPVTNRLLAKDARFATGALNLFGPVATLVPAGASELAALQSGSAAITANTFGAGRGIAYSFYPGAQYWYTADRSDLKQLPRNWGAAQRRLAVAPVQIAKTPRPVTVSQELVEAARLQSEKGIAVVLLNWSASPINDLAVTIPKVGKFRKVTTAQGVALKSTFAGDTLKVTLPLKDVDVLMIE